MSEVIANSTSENGVIDPRWKDLYKIGGISALISVIIIIIGIITYFIWPYAPGRISTEEIFILMQTNKIAGLISLDFVLVIGNIFGIILFLALYVSLRRVNESYALIALVLGLLADILIIPARPIAEILTLSSSFSAATTLVAKSQYLAAGEALLSLFNGTSWILNTLLGGISLSISSYLMLKSKIFSKATAYVGLLTNIAVTLFFIPIIGLFLLFLSLPGYIIWYIQLARRFFQMSK